MKYLVLLMLVLISKWAVAQTLHPVAKLDSLATPMAAVAPADTVAALHHLFAARRKRNLYGLTATIVLSTAGLVLSGELNGEGIADSRDMARFFIPFLGIPATGILAISYTSSRKRERRAIREFQAHRLPSSLKYALSPEYFKR